MSWAPTVEFNLSHPGDPPELEGAFGRYTILRRLGKGGMGRVYLARDTQLDRPVALKVPFLDVGDHTVARERFYREARAAATLHHPNICPVYDVGIEGNTPYLTMAYIDGMTLHEWARSPRPICLILDMVRKIALALHEAHLHGIVHRDLKPSNVLIDRRGEPVVLDFGLARRLNLPDESRLTSPGLLIGTPAYMPPEYIRGQEEPSQAGDIYSLGMLLYELLAGRCPFGGDILAVLAQVVADPVPPLSQVRPDLDPRLEVICMKAIANKPSERFGNMSEFAEALATVPNSTDSTVSTSRLSDEKTPADPLHGLDVRLVPKILGLFRSWGWARALQKVRNRAQHADSARERAGYQSFLDCIATEHTSDSQQALTFEGVSEARALRGWVLAGQASLCLRNREYGGAQALLSLAAGQGDAEDRVLQATIAHTRATALVHLGQSDAALPHLHQALDLFGQKHFMTGRVLDTLGMAYAYKGNFPVARDFYEQSIRFKRTHDDEAGVAISHGQLGRLYLDWGRLDEADQHFQEDLRIAQKIRSHWSEAQIYNHLGQVALERGVRESAAGRKTSARRQWGLASGWLEQSIRYCQEGNYPVSEAFARKDRALVYLHEGDLDRAELFARQALELFSANEFTEGVAKVHLVEGVILRRRERWADADRRFRAALSHFEQTQEADKAVHALWEIARTQRDSGAAAPLVTRAYLEALTRAEACRHDPLVRDIEQELHEVDVEAYLRHVYRRARGAGIDEDSPSLIEGTDDVGTILAIDLPGFTEFSHGLDAETVLLTFNHLLADFAEVLARHQARVLAYRGSGLLALTRDHRHAERAVRAALDLVRALDEFNRPRHLLLLPIFHVRIGISSGDVLLGNVGTYHKMDFTAIGTTLNIASALRNEAQMGYPCIGRSTFDLVRDRIVYHGTGPRSVAVVGIGDVEVWDVVGVKG
jgi:serine/threonine protein kinase/class 3 adenylate cyclase